MKVVIIGGVAGGATAAARIRRLDEKRKFLYLNVPDMCLMPIVGYHTISGE